METVLFAFKKLFFLHRVTLWISLHCFKLSVCQLHGLLLKAVFMVKDGFTGSFQDSCQVYIGACQNATVDSECSVTNCIH